MNDKLKILSTSGSARMLALKGKEDKNKAQMFDHIQLQGRYGLSSYRKSRRKDWLKSLIYIAMARQSYCLPLPKMRL